MILALLTAAHATTSTAALDPTALALLSDATAFGDVSEVRTVYEGTMIWTVATLQLVDLDDEAEVWIPGGCLGGLCLTVAGAPWVEPGERVFVFLRNQRPTSLSQGLFHISDGVALRDTHGISFTGGQKPAPAYDVEALTALQPLVKRIGKSGG